MSPALKVYDGTTWQYLNGGTAPPIQLGYAQVIADQNTITTIADLTGLTTTVTVAAGRTVKITGYAEFTASVANNRADLWIYEGATALNRGTTTIVNTGYTCSVQVEAVLTPSAGAHTYKLRAELGGGSGNVSLRAGATIPAFILVEDITGGSGSLDSGGAAILQQTSEPASPVAGDLWIDTDEYAASGTSGLLANVAYDPGTFTTKTATGTITAMDTTNLTVTFTAPASGAVLVKLSALARTANGNLYWGVVNAAGTQQGRCLVGSYTGAQIYFRPYGVIKITGLTAGTSYTYRFAIMGAGETFYGDTGNGNPATMEVWAA